MITKQAENINGSQSEKSAGAGATRTLLGRCARVWLVSFAIIPLCASPTSTFAQEADAANPKPELRSARDSDEIELPSIEMLEFLGEWQTDDGDWVDPSSLLGSPLGDTR